MTLSFHKRERRNAASMEAGLQETSVAMDAALSHLGL
jgi:hypothetical protein